MLEPVRASKPDLDLVLTHVDDRFDKNMRDAIGAAASRVLPLLDRQNVLNRHLRLLRHRILGWMSGTNFNIIHSS